MSQPPQGMPQPPQGVSQPPQGVSQPPQRLPHTKSGEYTPRTTGDGMLILIHIAS